MIYFVAVGGFLLINYLVGAAVWSACDDEKKTLFRWYQTAPDDFMQLVPFLTLQAWPVAVWILWRRHRGKR